MKNLLAALLFSVSLLLLLIGSIFAIAAPFMYPCWGTVYSFSFVILVFTITGYLHLQEKDKQKK